MLIKGIERYGVDNWVEIADFLGSKTANECEEHYYSYYYKSKTDKIPRTDILLITRK